MAVKRNFKVEALIASLKEERTSITEVPKKPTWDRQAFWKNSDLAFLVKGKPRATEYSNTFKCDVWTSDGAMHFKTGKAHGETTKGFADWRDALDFLVQMIEAGVQGHFDIAQNAENGLWYIISTKPYTAKPQPQPQK